MSVITLHTQKALRRELKIYEEHGKRYAPWSASKAQLAAKCPKAFAYRYIEHAPALQKGSAGVMGNIAHRALEFILTNPETPPTTALVRSLAESAHVHEALTQKNLLSLYSFIPAFRDFVSRIENFKAKKEQENNLVTDVLLEQKWAIRHDFSCCAYEDPEAMVRGVVDLVVLLQSGHVLIIDHKTGKTRPKSYYQAQLNLYTVLALSHLPGLVGAQCALHYVERRQLEWAEPVTPGVIHNLLRPWLLTYLNRRAVRAHTRVAFPTKLCGWCDYRAICPDVYRPNPETPHDVEKSAQGGSGGIEEDAGTDAA
jgi:putative RecB family exonuclease